MQSWQALSEVVRMQRRMLQVQIEWIKRSLEKCKNRLAEAERIYIFEVFETILRGMSVLHPT